MAKTAVAPTKKIKTAKIKASGPARSSPLAAANLDIRVGEDRIRERAYDIWIAEGRPDGRELAHWTRATYELLAAPPQ
jgi:hypothetical protein